MTDRRGGFIARRGLAPLLVVALAAAPAAGQAIVDGPLPAPLPVLPADHWWNLDVSAAPVDPRSAANIAFVGGTTVMHPDFGGDVDPDDPTNPEIYGLPYVSVPGSQPRLAVAFGLYGDESDDGAPGRPAGYPIPEEAKTQPRWLEGGHPGSVDPGGDRHLLIVDRDNRILYELYRAFWNAALGRWEADSGAIFPLDGNARRPEGWTSADAAGFAILPGLVRHDEVFGADPIRHAFRVTLEATRGHVFPASHTATTSASLDALPLGARLRLKASTDVADHPAYVQKIFQAMKTYGLLVADNGTSLYVQGTYDTRWDNDVLNPAFASLEASDFEVVELGWRPPAATDATTPRDFHTVSPCRVLDTRLPAGSHGGPALYPANARANGLAPETTYWNRVVRVAGVCGLPAQGAPDAPAAVAVNVTVIPGTAGGHLTLYPGDQYPGAAVGPPATSTLNFAPGRVRANNAVVPLAASGSGTLALAVTLSSPAPVDVALDVFGYFE